MRKTKQFYFPLFPNEWLMGTVNMTNSQKGLYIDLLVIQFQNGDLPYDLFLRRAEGVIEDVEAVIQKFKKNKNGTYYNVKLKEIKNEIERTREMNSKGGRNSQVIQREKKSKKDGGTEVTSEATSNSLSSNARLTLEERDLIDSSIEPIIPKTYNSLDELYKEIYTEGE
jgi:uncharacterized protein YdaU (DUF1376 family)